MVKLNYFSAKLLKDALVELGYLEAQSIKNKKDLIAYTINLIQNANEDNYISDSDDDDEIITIDMSKCYDKLRSL
jgi:hypothetical protein